MTETANRYRCLVFDLDDTLLDTYGRLVPVAAREACQAMIEAGLDAGPAECFVERARYIAQQPRGDVYAHLVGHFGIRTGHSETEVIQVGFRAFHQRDVGNDVALFDDAESILGQLAKNYRLYLVTAGDEKTQRRKVELAGIQRYFRGVLYVDPSRGQSKAQAFREIFLLEKGEPHSFLSIGNRVDTDIAPAKELGWDTCWVRIGEYAHLVPANPHENPDFVIPHIRDLGQKCRL